VQSVSGTQEILTPSVSEAFVRKEICQHLIWQQAAKGRARDIDVIFAMDDASDSRASRIVISPLSYSAEPMRRCHRDGARGVRSNFPVKNAYISPGPAAA